MIPEFVISIIIGLVVLGGLAFHDAVASRVVALDRDPELTELEEFD